MLIKIFLLTCLFFIITFVQPTTCALSNEVQNLEYDDITSLWDKFPSIIDKIKETGMLFKCDKSEGH